MGLPPPQKASARLVPAKDIFLKLATMAAFPRFQAAWMLFYRGRHLKQLGLGGDDSSFLRLTLGLAILAVGGIYAFRFFSNMRCSLVGKVKYNLAFPPDRP